MFCVGNLMEHFGDLHVFLRRLCRGGSLNRLMLHPADPSRSGTSHPVCPLRYCAKVMGGNTMLAFGAFHINSYPPVASGMPPAGTFNGGSLDQITQNVADLSVVGSRRPTSLPAVSELVGASEETGGLFDPLGLAADEVS